MICLFACSHHLAATDHYYCYCLSDNQWWQCIKVCRKSRLLIIRMVSWQKQVTVSGIICVCVYLVSEERGRYTCDSVHGSTYHYHSYWWMVQQFNIPWLYQNNLLQLMYRQLFMLRLISYMSYDDHSFCVKEIARCWVILIVHLWLHPASYDWSNNTPIPLL